eukprot:SAG31_NODE_20112_length_583_cov_1.322314_1_plen_36_part_10
MLHDGGNWRINFAVHRFPEAASQQPSDRAHEHPILR